MFFRRILFLIGLNLFLFFVATSQNVDSLTRQMQKMVLKMDSLERMLLKTQNRMVTHSEFESIFRAINEDDQEFTNENRRSKRRALDSLIRSAIARPGQLTFTGQLMSVLHWDGKAQHSINTAVGILDLFAISSFGKNNLVFINLQGVGGDGPSQSFEAVHGLHAGAGSTQDPNGTGRVTILEAWTEFKLGMATVTAGKIDLTNYFDPNSVANDEYSQFLSSGFVNSLALAAPTNVAGIVASFDFPQHFIVTVGGSSLDNLGMKIFENVMGIYQIGKSFHVRNEPLGALRYYVYHYPNSQKKWGWGLSGDIRVFKSLYMFGRFGQNSVSLSQTFGVSDAWSTGMQARNLKVSNRLFVTLGLAHSVIKKYDETTRYPERGLEMYARIALKNKFYLSPIWQYIINGNGNKNNNLSILGLRTRLVF